jgi:hypothetical protein
MPRLVLLVLHGMGVVEPGYYLELQAGLAARFGERWSEVSLQAVQYADIFQRNEDALWQAMQAEPLNQLDWARLRQFFLYYFADATAFERSFHVDKQTYLEVQQRITDKLAAGFAACGGFPGTPLAVIAHSLGCQVFSSYAWDTLNDRGPRLATPADDFCRLQSWRRFLSMGCNIPIFTAGLRRRQNFAPPVPDFEWHNYYDPDDVLGWPLAQLDASYATVQDHPVEVGGILTGWTPLSHIEYWSDDELLDTFAAHIDALLH